ncbi:MAG: FkbM family methyltransferase [Alphaproteobacteria bacterium]
MAFFKDTSVHIIDVGAQYSASGGIAYQGLLDRGNAQIIGFEPLEEECARLNTLFKEQNHLYLPYVIGDGSAQVFNQYRFSQKSSFYELNVDLWRQFTPWKEAYEEVVAKIPVDTHRLDDVLEIKDNDFMKLDVQGAELDVLRGASSLLDQTVCVHAEVEFVPLYKNQPLFADVDSFLRSEGFVLHSFVNVNRRSFKPFNLSKNTNQFLWADAVYVKDFMQLDQLSPEKMVKMVLILHHVYQSYDLCTMILRAYDKRMQTQHMVQYLQGFKKKAS